MSITRKFWHITAIMLVLRSGLSAPTLTLAEETTQPAVKLIAREGEHPAHFLAEGLPSDLRQRLAALEPTDPEFAKVFTVTVVADSSGVSALPPVAGRYRIDDTRLIFVPRFPPQPGLTYRALLHGSRSVSRDLSIPKVVEQVPHIPTYVRHVFPSSEVLPENHLRFYIHFSQPMSRSIAYDNLELLDETGKVIEAAFLELGEELWDPSSQRLTLLLDPGRIKRGLKPREEDGPILVAGKNYTLVVKQAWTDARGKMLKSDFRKSFTAGPAREQPLSTADWKIQVPQADTNGLLSVRFPYPLDYALLNRLLTVTDTAGQPVPGKQIVCAEEQRWTFQPDSQWPAGPYQLVIDTVLEDSAGNRIGRAFEVDQAEDVTEALVSEFVKLPFEIKRPGPVAATQSAPAAQE